MFSELEDEEEAVIIDREPGERDARVAQQTSDLERTGLCVICQDEEAIMAVVDCG
jgi:hypothetical protein